MDECHTFEKCVFDLKINLGHSDLYFLFTFALKNILVLLAMLNAGELCCPATALIQVVSMLQCFFRQNST